MGGIVTGYVLGDKISRQSVPEKMLGDCPLGCARIPLQAYKSLCAAVMICATMVNTQTHTCLLYTSPSPRDGLLSRMPSSA